VIGQFKLAAQWVKDKQSKAADEAAARQKAEEAASHQATVDELKAQLPASTDTADADITADAKAGHAHASIEQFEAEAAAQQATIDELKAQLVPVMSKMLQESKPSSKRTRNKKQVSAADAAQQATQIQALKGTQASNSSANQTNSKKAKWHPSAFTMAELHQYLKGLFSIADQSGDGILQLPELKQLLQLCGFELTSEQIANFVVESYTSVLTVICCTEQATHVQLLESKLLQQSEAAEQTATEVRELTTQLQDAERVLRQSQSGELLAEVFSMGWSMVVFVSAVVVNNKCNT